MTNDDRSQASHILIADDDPAIRSLFAAALRTVGENIDGAATAGAVAPASAPGASAPGSAPSGRLRARPVARSRM